MNGDAYMPYDRAMLERLLDTIPRGRVTTHGILARALGTRPRAVAPAVCHSQSAGRIRVVLQGGKLPHQDDLDDCRDRARQLEAEGIPVSDDRRRVLVTEAEMWTP